jgi:hypothetical protein
MYETRSFTKGQKKGFHIFHPRCPAPPVAWMTSLKFPDPPDGSVSIKDEKHESLL